MARLSEKNLAAYIAGEVEIPEQEGLVGELASDLRIASPGLDVRVFRALGAIRSGLSADLVARSLDWRDFERFCAALLRARGFTVRENLILTKPRAQVDILARCPSMALLIDCKHWARGRGPSAMSKVAKAQAARAGLVRKRMGWVEPLAVVILALTDEQTRFTEGAAVVPVHTLGDFLSNLPLYAEHLSFF